eukprot:3572278-Amphidinium_carterae.2
MGKRRVEKSPSMPVNETSLRFRTLSAPTWGEAYSTLNESSGKISPSTLNSLPLPSQSVHSFCNMGISHSASANTNPTTRIPTEGLRPDLSTT